MFTGIIGVLGEIREDTATWVKYRYNGTTWIVNGTGTPSSAWFPTTWNTAWEIREDLLTWGEYKWSGSAWVLIVNNDSDNDEIPTTVEDLGITTAKIAADAVTSAKIDPGVIKTATVTITSAELLAMFTTPKTLVDAPAAWKAIIVDRIVASIDYGTAAYATNTTLEFRYTNGSGTKVSADVAALLNATADKAVSVGWLASELVLTPAAALVANVATDNPITWDSPITVTVVYRII